MTYIKEEYEQRQAKLEPLINKYGLFRIMRLYGIVLKAFCEE